MWECVDYFRLGDVSVVKWSDQVTRKRTQNMCLQEDAVTKHLSLLCGVATVQSRYRICAEVLHSAHLLWACLVDISHDKEKACMVTVSVAGLL